MAAPATPTNPYINQSAGVIALAWDFTAGATAYTVQRSTDQITYSTLSAVITATNYSDTTGSIGTQYWYRIKATNTDGSSAYTTDTLTMVPAPAGEMSLLELRLRAQQRADRVNSQFVTTSEWNSNIAQSLYDLYDILTVTYEEYKISSVNITMDGTNYLYALPTGSNYSSAAAFYKLRGVDLALNTASNAWVTIHKYNFEDRNRYLYPNTASTIYGVFNMRYRVLGANIAFTPTPSGNQTVRLWYYPRLSPCLKDSDVTDIGTDGWLEYVIVDAAIKALQKEESDCSLLLAQKAAIVLRIQGNAANRDAGEPDSIADVRSFGSNSGYNPFGFSGPFGGV